jgi:hypothetical protein
MLNDVAHGNMVSQAIDWSVSKLVSFGKYSEHLVQEKRVFFAAHNRTRKSPVILNEYRLPRTPNSAQFSFIIGISAFEEHQQPVSLQV